MHKQVKSISLAKHLTTALEEAFGLRESGNYGEALHKFERLEACSIHPRDIAILRFFQATCLTDLSRPTDALSRLSTVDKSRLTHERQVDFVYEQARIERALGNLTAALDLITLGFDMLKSISTLNDMTMVSQGLQTLQAILLAESGKAEEAIPKLLVVPQEDDGWAEAMIKLGDCLILKREYKQAVDCYSKVLFTHVRVYRGFRDAAIRNIGCAYYYMRDYTTAIKYFQQVEDKYDDDISLKVELFALMKSCYIHLGLADEAQKYATYYLGSQLIN